jgi:hypothetical protein
MPLPEDTRRRVRMALDMGGYGSVEKLAEELAERDSGIGLKRLRTIWQNGEARAVELREIADACQTPYWFMEYGFAIETREADLREEIDELRRSVHDLIAQVAQHGRALRELRDQGQGTGSAEDDPR